MLLAAECGKNGNIMSLFVAARGDFVLVGDLMMSLNVLQYNSLDSKLTDVACTLCSQSLLLPHMPFTVVVSRWYCSGEQR